MDIVTIGKDGTRLGIINGDQLIQISDNHDLVNRKILFGIKIKYSDINWARIRDAKEYFDNEVPEVKVTVDMLSVVNDYIVVIGHTPDYILN